MYKYHLKLKLSNNKLNLEVTPFHAFEYSPIVLFFQTIYTKHFFV